MATSRIKYRNSAWAPTLAAALSLLLIVGQTLTCCHLNETLSASVGQFLASLSHSGAQQAKATETAGRRKTHAGCHGHGPENESGAPAKESEAPPLPAAAGGPLLQADEPCLSEIASSPKAVQPVSAPDISLPSWIVAYLPDPALPYPARPNQPRPQNKSSPPIYLLTLRLLV